MKIKLILFFILISLSGFSQVPGWVWAKDAGGKSYDDATSVTTDNAGNVYVCGSFYQDTIILGNDTLRTAGLTDLFLIKYDPSGNIIWVKQSGGTSDEFPAAVTTDLWGNIYFVGTFSSTSITFGNTTLLNPNLGFPDIFIVKYDTNGNVLWAKREGQSDYDFASSVVTDPVNGEPYLAGAFYANSITIGTTTLPNNGLYDALLIKYDTAGNELWARSSGGTLNDLGNGVSIDRAGKVYVAGGYASASMTFGTTTLTNVSAGFPDIFTVKYDSAGTVLWAKSEGGTDNDHAVTVANDTAGNVFVGGHFHSTSFPFASTTLTNNGMGDIFLLKYDSAGNAMWGINQGGSDMDFGYSVAVDQTGNSYFTGMFMSMSVIFGSTTLTNASMDEDMFIVKYDPMGNEIWALSAGGMNRDYINCVTVNSSGNLYAVGSFGSPAIMIGATTFTNADSSGTTSDIFVGKLDVVTGTIQNINAQNFSAYPNPSSGKFILTGINSPANIIVCNTLGEKIYSEINNNSQNEIDLSNQPNGIYFVTIETEKESITRKIIISR
jgi:hypothetical protein